LGPRVAGALKPVTSEPLAAPGEVGLLALPLKSWAEAVAADNARAIKTEVKVFI
jgi:hypothetical protein